MYESMMGMGLNIGALIGSPGAAPSTVGETVAAEERRQQAMREAAAVAFYEVIVPMLPHGGMW